MIFGTKKYRLTYRLKRWWQKNFYPYNEVNNRQCGYGIRCKYTKPSEKCKNRFNPLVCGECWRADRIRLKKNTQRRVKSNMVDVKGYEGIYAVGGYHWKYADEIIESKDN